MSTFSYAIERLRRRQRLRYWALALPILILGLSLPLLRPLRHPDPRAIADDEWMRLATIRQFATNGSFNLDPETVKERSCFLIIPAADTQTDAARAGTDTTATTQSSPANPSLAPPITPPATPASTKKPTPGARILAAQEPMLSVIGAGIYLLLRLAGVTVAPENVLGPYLLTLILSTIPVATTSTLIYRCARLLELPRGRRIVLAFAAVTCVGLLPYATVLSPYPLAALCITASFACLVHVLTLRPLPGGTPWLLLTGFLGGLAATIHPSVAGLSLAIGLCPLFLPLRKRRTRLAAVLLIYIGSFPPLAAHRIMMQTFAPPEPVAISATTPNTATATLAAPAPTPAAPTPAFPTPVAPAPAVPTPTAPTPAVPTPLLPPAAAPAVPTPTTSNVPTTTAAPSGIAATQAATTRFVASNPSKPSGPAAPTAAANQNSFAATTSAASLLLSNWTVPAPVIDPTSEGAAATRPADDEEQTEISPAALAALHYLLATLSTFVGQFGLLTHYPVLLLAALGVATTFVRHWPTATRRLALACLLGFTFPIAIRIFGPPLGGERMYGPQSLVASAPTLLLWAGVFLRTHSTRPHNQQRANLTWTLAIFSALIGLIGLLHPYRRGGFSLYPPYQVIKESLTSTTPTRPSLPPPDPTTTQPFKPN